LYTAIGIFIQRLFSDKNKPTLLLLNFSDDSINGINSVLDDNIAVKIFSFKETKIARRDLYLKG